MRVWFGVSLCLVCLITQPTFAQPKKEPQPAKTTSRTIVANLETPVKATPFLNPMRMSEFLEIAAAELERRERGVVFTVDEEAFRDEHGDFDFYATDISLKNLPANPTVMQVLKQAVRQVPMKSTFIIRAGKVEIVLVARTSKEYLLNQTVRAEFTERRLDQALEELGELTGVSIVMDGRVKQKAQAAVSARFHDDIALQDAVRILTDMAELKVVYLVTGLYVTTPEHAKVMQKELKEIYERPAPTFNFPLFGPMIGGPTEADLPPSPLTPPLPPLKRRADPGAV